MYLGDIFAGIEPRFRTFKASTLPPELSLWVLSFQYNTYELCFKEMVNTQNERNLHITNRLYSNTHYDTSKIKK